LNQARELGRPFKVSGGRQQVTTPWIGYRNWDELGIRRAWAKDPSAKVLVSGAAEALFYFAGALASPDCSTRGGAPLRFARSDEELTAKNGEGTP
jgi:hypothetical protein